MLEFAFWSSGRYIMIPTLSRAKFWTSWTCRSCFWAEYRTNHAVICRCFGAGTIGWWDLVHGKGNQLVISLISWPNLFHAFPIIFQKSKAFSSFLVIETQLGIIIEASFLVSSVWWHVQLLHVLNQDHAYDVLSYNSLHYLLALMSNIKWRRRHALLFVSLYIAQHLHIHYTLMQWCQGLILLLLD